MEKLEKSLIIGMVVIMVASLIFMATSVYIVSDIANQYKMIKAENRDLQMDLYKCMQPNINCSNPTLKLDGYWYCNIDDVKQ